MDELISYYDEKGNIKKVASEVFADFVAYDMCKCIIRQFPDENLIPNRIVEMIFDKLKERTDGSTYVRLKRGN